MNIKNIKLINKNNITLAEAAAFAAAGLYFNIKGGKICGLIKK